MVEIRKSTDSKDRRPDGAIEKTTIPGRQPVSIVVPTFREASNIPALAERIHATLSETGIEWELLLVDDNSDDGSQAIVAELARRLPVRMEVRSDQPRDLSLAVLEGVRLARFDHLVVMDADLSHPPERIIDLLGALDAGCDMVIGSRYAPGALIDHTWSLYRVANSRLATWLARPLVRCADPMSGFFAIDRRVLPTRKRCNPSAIRLRSNSWYAGGCGSRKCLLTFGTGPWGRAR